MTSNPYDYENRQGLLPISWEYFHALCKGLAAAASTFNPEIILPIGRGGYYPGTLISHLLQAEVYPVRVSRRVNDVVTYKSPQWLLEPPAAVKGRRVLIVDEIASSGETLQVVKDKVMQLGAAEARSAVLYAHSWATEVPDYIGLISDALILNPWDREIWKDGAFQVHPEYLGALEQQGLTPPSKDFIIADAVKIAKGI
jgi:uncharacterized protein